MTYYEYYSDYKWIKVKRYKMDEAKSWEDRYKDLDDHHIKETKFLIDEVRYLAAKLDKAEDKEVQAAKKEKRADFWRSFMVMWFGGMLMLALATDMLIDKKTQYANHALITTIMIMGGLIFSSILSYCKWRGENVTEGTGTKEADERSSGRQGEKT